MTEDENQQDDVGRKVLRVNYGQLFKSVDPQVVRQELFAQGIISFEIKSQVKKTQEQSGRDAACEELLDILFSTWKEQFFWKFHQVLKECGYEVFAETLKGNEVM